MLKLTFLGHSVFQLAGDRHTLIIDPFLTGNPMAGMPAEQVKVDYILLTHAHGDHIGDALEIAERTGATIIAPFELATYCSQKGANTHPLHIGGSWKFPFGRVKFTQAFHGSTIIDGDSFVSMGNPVGILVDIGGKRVYHAGDTGLFGDMKLIGELEKPDVALLPIGDNFTMGPDDALLAAEWINPKLVIPMHFDTFDLIKQDGSAFVKKLLDRGIQGQVVESGGTIDL